MGGRYAGKVAFLFRRCVLLVVGPLLAYSRLGGWMGRVGTGRVGVLACGAWSSGFGELASRLLEGRRC